MSKVNFWAGWFAGIYGNLEEPVTEGENAQEIRDRLDATKAALDESPGRALDTPDLPFHETKRDPNDRFLLAFERLDRAMSGDPEPEEPHGLLGHA